jgi:hypothetical protein
MTRLKSIAPPRRRRPIKTKELSLEEALKRVTDPDIAECLSSFFAELSRAQRAGDEEMIREANRSIIEAMRGVHDGEFDEPLLTALRKRKPHRR